MVPHTASWLVGDKMDTHTGVDSMLVVVQRKHLWRRSLGQITDDSICPQRPSTKTSKLKVCAKHLSKDHQWGFLIQCCCITPPGSILLRAAHQEDIVTTQFATQLNDPTRQPAAHTHIPSPMKTTQLFFAIVGLLGGSTTATMSSDIGTVHASSPLLGLKSANNTKIGPTRPQGRFIEDFGYPVFLWWYNSKLNGPYACTANFDTKPWAMAKMYRSGGKENVHWKYTDDPNDRECLQDWKYYRSNGLGVYAWVKGRITTARSHKSWCALPVYRSGGVQGKQWAYCTKP